MADSLGSFFSTANSYSGQYRLAIDTGVSTIGWAIYDLTLEPGTGRLVPRENGLLAIGTRAFNDGREPAAKGRVGEPKAVARRMARGNRRNRDRKQDRKRRTCSELVIAGLLPSDADARKHVVNKLNPLKCRAKAAQEPVDAETLGRALFHLGQRRGFKSNRKTDGGDEKEGKSRAEKIGALDLAMVERKTPTLGMFLHSEHEAGRSTRFRPESAYFSMRRHYEDEFDAIRALQAPHHPSVSEAAWDAIRCAIFDQRPLKPVQKGRCRFYPEDERLHAATPSAENYRLAETLARLRWVDTKGVTQTLNDAQRRAVAEQVSSQKSVAFSKLKKLKTAENTLLFPDIQSFNLESIKEKGLKGAETACEMRKPELFGELWDTLSLDQQDHIVMTMQEAENDEAVLSLARDHGLSEEQAKAVAAKSWPRKTLSIGKTLARTATPLMESGLRYDQALEALGLHHSLEDAPGGWDMLPYYGVIEPGGCTGGDPRKDADEDPQGHYGRIPNPSVHVALNQMRVVVNDIIERFGPPEQVVIEVGRDVKNTAKQREDIMRDQAANQAENERLAAEAKKLGAANPDRRTIERFRAWEALNKDPMKRACLYCGELISGAQVANGEAQVDHILPFSRSFDDSRANKIIAHASCNRKKGNQTPYEKFGDDPKSGDLWRKIVALVAEQPPSRRWRFEKDAMERFEAGADIGDGEDEKAAGFIARQLTDNHYIARVTRKYLRAVCPNVWTTSSRITGMLRGFLRLNAGLGIGVPPHPLKKDRADNRHNAVDAAVIGLVDRGLLQKISAEHSATGVVQIRLADRPEWVHGNLKQLLMQCVVSHKPDHGVSGPFFNETAYAQLKEERRDPELPDYDLVARKGFATLTPKEIERIRDPYLRNTLQDWLAAPQQKAANRPLNRLLETFAAEVWPNLMAPENDETQRNPMRRVRLLHKNASAEQIPSAPYKSYAIGSYAYVDIWRVPKGKAGKWKAGEFDYVGEFIDYKSAALEKETNGVAFNAKRDRRPHSAAKHIMRLFKQDMVVLTENGQRVAKTIKGFSTTNNRLDIADHFAANADQKYVSINALVKDMAMQKLWVTPCGAIRNPEALKIQPTGR